MSKIVQAVNSMIANSDAITDVKKGGEETFFRFKNKYSWSIARTEGGVRLWYYPNASVEELVSRAEHSAWDDVDMVSYHDKELGTREAKASFEELLRVVQERAYAMDEVLADIIGDDDEGI